MKMQEIRGMWFPASDRHFAKMMRLWPEVDGRGTYQFERYEEVMRQVRARRHAVDIGAHVGLWSRLLARDFDRVTAFEPCAGHVACFRRNLDGADNVTLHEVALGEKARRVSIRVPADNTGHAQVDRRGDDVEMRTLDSYDLTDVDLIKIDVEGFEYHVVSGAELTLAENRPIVIVEQKPKYAETYGRKRLDAVEFLTYLGMVRIAEIHGDYIMGWP